MMDKKEIENYATSVAYEASKWLRTQYYDDFFLASIKLDWSPSRVSSRGGLYKAGPGINIAMAHSYPMNRGTIYRYYEYASYDSNKEIGGFYSKIPLHKLESVVLHEVAHAIQFFAYTAKNVTRDKPHGPLFKQYYRALRLQFLNYKLPDQALLRKEYQDYCNSISKL